MKFKKGDRIKRIHNSSSLEKGKIYIVKKIHGTYLSVEDSAREKPTYFSKYFELVSAANFTYTIY